MNFRASFFTYYQCCKWVKHKVRRLGHQNYQRESIAFALLNSSDTALTDDKMEPSSSLDYEDSYEEPLQIVEGFICSVFMAGPPSI